MGHRGRKNTRGQDSQVHIPGNSAQRPASILPSPGQHPLEESATSNTSARATTSAPGHNSANATRWGHNTNSSRLLSEITSQCNDSSDTEQSNITAAKTELWNLPSMTIHKTSQTPSSVPSASSLLVGDKLSVDVTRANAGVATFSSQLPSKPDPSASFALPTSSLAFDRCQSLATVTGTGDGAQRRVSTGQSLLCPAVMPDHDLPRASATNGLVAVAAPTIDPRILDQAVRAVLHERFGVSSLNQLPPLQAQTLLSGPLPQLIASYLQTLQGSAGHASSLLASANTAGSERVLSNTSDVRREEISASSPRQPHAPPIALLPASPAPYPADALPSEIQIEQNTNLYLNGLGDYVTDDELLRIGSQFGEVISHKAIINSETGLCKGYGFIMFAWAKDAAVAMVELQKRGYQTSFARHESFSAKLRMMSDARSTNVYVSNLPLTMTDQQLEQLVAPHTIVSRRILTKVDGTSRGVGFIRFHSREAAQECIDRLHGKRLIGHPHPLQARFADSENQKRLKQDTSLRKVYADLDMGVLANHPASTGTRRSMSQNSFSGVARPAGRAVSSTGMTTGRSDPGALRPTSHIAGVGGVPMISPTSSLAGFYPGPIGAPGPHSPLWAAATMSHNNQSGFLSQRQNVWSSEPPAFHLASSPAATPAKMTVPPYWNQKASSTTDGSGQQGSGTPSLSPSGSASTLGSPAVSLDAMGQGIGTTVVNHAALSFPQLNNGGSFPAASAFPSDWAMSIPLGAEIERQMKGLSVSPGHQNLFAFEQKATASTDQHGRPSITAAVGQGPSTTTTSAFQGTLPLFGHHLDIAAQTVQRATASLSGDRTTDAPDSHENPLQSSNFVPPSAQKTVIPIIDPETGKAWAISGPSASSNLGDGQCPQQDDTANKVVVPASSSAPVVTVSASEDSSPGSPNSFEDPVGQIGQSAVFTTSSSAPALLGSTDQPAAP